MFPGYLSTTFLVYRIFFYYPRKEKIISAKDIKGLADFSIFIKNQGFWLFAPLFSGHSFFNRAFFIC